MQRTWKTRMAWAIALALVATLALAGAQEAKEAQNATQGPVPAAEPETNRELDPVASTGEDVGPPARDTAPGEVGVRVRIDPLTGEILRRPDDPGVEDQAAEDGTTPVTGPRGWLNTYGDDLVQEPLPGGGFKVDLRGRFQSAVVATIDPDTGAVEVDCVVTPDPAEAADDR